MYFFGVFENLEYLKLEHSSKKGLVLIFYVKKNAIYFYLSPNNLKAINNIEIDLNERTYNNNIFIVQYM